MPSRGDIIRGAGGLLKRNTNPGVGSGHPTSGDEGDIRVQMVDGSPHLYARAGNRWYRTNLSDVASDEMKIGDAENYIKVSRGDIELTGKITLTNVGSAANRDNICIGVNNSIKGVDNVIIGKNAVPSGAPTNNNNVIIGSNAAYTLSKAPGNVVIGKDAGYSMTVSSGMNVMVGYTAGYNCTTGVQNVFIGERAGYGDSAQTGDYNIGIGSESLDSLTDGNMNVAIGHEAGEDITSGRYNTLVGIRAGQNITTTGDEATHPSSNTCIGLYSGDVISTGARNITLGAFADCAATVDDQIAIGYSTVTSGTFGIAIGNNISAATNTFVFGKTSNYATSTTFTNSGACTFTFASDERKKTNIKDVVIGLDFINELRPRTFNWKPSEEYPEEWHAWNEDENGNRIYHEIDTETTMHGFIAQEGKEVLDKYGVTSTIDVWAEGEEGIQRFNENKLIIPLIKAVQELSAKVETLEAQIKE